MPHAQDMSCGEFAADSAPAQTDNARLHLRDDAKRHARAVARVLSFDDVILARKRPHFAAVSD
jgi:hypothetical protein